MINQRLRDCLVALIFIELVGAAVREMAQRSLSKHFSMAVAWRFLWVVAWLFRSRRNPVKSWWTA